MKAYCSDVAMKSTTVCTVSMKKLFSNSNNKHELIKLLSYVFTEHGIEVNVATDDADTMVASKVVTLSSNEDFEVKAEDTDILCFIIHHFKVTIFKKAVYFNEDGHLASLLSVRV